MAVSLPQGVDFRPMHPQDVDRVLEIIQQHDEDDYEEARETYQEGLDDQYVLTLDDWVIGATGAEEVEDTDRSWWLSWTYLDPERQGTGLGAVMIVKMIENLREWNARKVFVSSSDYVDLDRGEIYRDAIEAYNRLGFVEEVRHRNFYERNEAQIILGYRIESESIQGIVPESDQRTANLHGFDLIPETEDAYYVEWEFTHEEGGSAEGLERMIADVAKRKGRVLFAYTPSDAEIFASMLQSAGFREDGRLKDFYEDGIDEIHFRYDIM